jgi:hypothetical protein
LVRLELQEDLENRDVPAHQDQLEKEVLLEMLVRLVSQAHLDLEVKLGQWDQWVNAVQQEQQVELDLLVLQATLDLVEALVNEDPQDQ